MRAERLIGKGMKLVRDMGLSVTPKLHGLEIHLVGPMGMYPVIIALFMEQWLEQYTYAGSQTSSHEIDGAPGTNACVKRCNEMQPKCPRGHQESHNRTHQRQAQEYGG